MATEPKQSKIGSEPTETSFSVRRNFCRLRRLTENSEWKKTKQRPFKLQNIVQPWGKAFCEWNLNFSISPTMTPNFVRVLILTALFTSFASASDDDENFYFANNNNKFLFNTRQNCQPNYYFDVDYFRCRLCDPNFNLMATEQSEFDGKSIFISFYRGQSFEFIFLLHWRKLKEKRNTFDSFLEVKLIFQKLNLISR